MKLLVWNIETIVIKTFRAWVNEWKRERERERDGEIVSGSMSEKGLY